jgi:cytidylate kinase
MIITIDGPAGAGKSTAARALAKRLGFEFLDTGAMYRAVTLAALRARTDLTSREALIGLLEGFSLEMPSGKVILNGSDVSAEIRTPQVTEASGAIAGNRAVRSHLTQIQRAIAQGRDMVCEGRDQGTIVFPEAACKFFLTADPSERASRRYRELLARGQAVSYDEVLRSQQARDLRDRQRDLAPMEPAPDAILLDSTLLTLDQIVARMEEEVRRKQADA